MIVSAFSDISDNFGNALQQQRSPTAVPASFYSSAAPPVYSSPAAATAAALAPPPAAADPATLRMKQLTRPRAQSGTATERANLMPETAAAAAAHLTQPIPSQPTRRNVERLRNFALYGPSPEVVRAAQGVTLVTTQPLMYSPPVGGGGGGAGSVGVSPEDIAPGPVSGWAGLPTVMKIAIVGGGLLVLFLGWRLVARRRGGAGPKS